MAALGEQGDDIAPREGDQLIVPKLSQEVSVIAEVQSATLHLRQDDLEREDYMALSGGEIRLAYGGKAYGVRANGSVIAASHNCWFGGAGAMEIRPGDTIVVPLDEQRLRALPMWTAVIAIICNLAIAAAAIGRL